MTCPSAGSDGTAQGLDKQIPEGIGFYQYKIVVGSVIYICHVFTIQSLPYSEAICGNREIYSRMFGQKALIVFG